MHNAHKYAYGKEAFLPFAFFLSEATMQDYQVSYSIIARVVRSTKLGIETSRLEFGIDRDYGCSLT